MPEWINEFTHASVTDENKEAFGKSMEKYASKDDAIMGGFNAQKIAGAAFKFPESMDKLSDDAMRSDFTNKALKLLDREPVKNMEDFKDFNFTDGMADGATADETMKAAFAQHVIDSGMSKGMAAKDAKFFNTMMGKTIEANKVAADKQAIATAKAVDAELIADPDIGSQEKLTELSELFKRAITNHVGLKGDDIDEVVDAMIKGGLTQNAKLAKIMLKQFAPLAAEGNTDGGGGFGGSGSTDGGPGVSPYEWKKARWPKSESMWGKKEDTWETEPVATRISAGFKAKVVKKDA